MSSELKKLGVEAGQEVVFDQVLVVSGDEMKVGNPTVAGATVTSKRCKRRQSKKSDRLQIQEKNRLSQKEWSQTAVYTG